MSQGFNSKEEEIEDSLEFCKDIAVYYKNAGNEQTHSVPYSNFKPAYVSIPDTTGYAPDDENESLVKIIVSNIIHLIICVIIAAVISRLLNTYIVQQVSVDGSSMEEALSDGDRLLMNKLVYRFDAPKRFDIVIFPFEDDVFLVKRVIGLPGETIQIKDGYVYIDGELLQNDIYCDDLIDNPGIIKDSLTLGEDEVFVMGDNRNNSLDSRYTAVGNIKLNDIMGKALLRIYPFDRFGKVD